MLYNDLHSDAFFTKAKDEDWLYYPKSSCCFVLFLNDNSQLCRQQIGGAGEEGERR